MKIIVNDIPVELNSSVVTLEEVVLNSGITDMKGLAVAVNNAVIPRKTWGTFRLKENDIITIIRATQGG